MSQSKMHCCLTHSVIFLFSEKDYFSIGRLPVAIDSQIAPIAEGFAFRVKLPSFESSSMNVVLACFNRSSVPETSPFKAANCIPRQRRFSSLEYKEFLMQFESAQNISARTTSQGREETSMTKSTKTRIFCSSPSGSLITSHCLKSRTNSSGKLIAFWQTSESLLAIFSNSFKIRRKVSNPTVSFAGIEQSESATLAIFPRQ